MTTSTISALAPAASETLDALAGSAIGRGQGTATRGASPFAFERVLAAETDDPGIGAPPAPREASDAAAGKPHEPRRTGRPETPGVTDPEFDHGRDDQHAVGRTRSGRGREAVKASSADDTATSAHPNDDSHTHPGDGVQTADDAQAVAAVASQAGATTATSGAVHPAATSDPDGGTDAVTTGKGHRRAEMGGVVAVTDLSVVAVAALTPAVAGAQAGAKPGAKSDAGEGSRSSATTAANPAIPASPAIPTGKAEDGIAVAAKPATPAVPAHKSDPSGATVPAAASAGPGAAPPAAGSNATHDGTSGNPGTSGSEVGAGSAAPSSPETAPARPAATNVTPAVPAERSAEASATLVSTGTDTAAPARRDSRSRGAAATAKAGPDAVDGHAVEADPTLPTTTSDIARTRASMARIVAASADGAGDAHSHGGVPAPASQAGVPAASVVAGTPAADAALAAIAAARQTSPTGSTPTGTTTAASTTAPAADRLAFEALDRIRTTVTAGVPGLESRIEDPELGTIRIVVSARLGETIRAEIVARDPAAARELTSGIDRALAAGAVLPGNVDLRIRSEAASPAPRSDAHHGQGGGEHGRPQDQPAAGGAFGGGSDSGAGSSSTRDGGAAVAADVSALAPAHGRTRGLDPVPAATSSTPGALRPGTALDVRA